MSSSPSFMLSLGAATTLVTLTHTILCILEASSLCTGKVSLAALPVAASVFNSFSLCCVILFSTEYAWRYNGISGSIVARRLLTAFSVFFSIVALSLTLASFISIKTRQKEIAAATSHSLIKRWDGYIAGQIVIWVVTCILHGLLYSTPLWTARSDEGEGLRAIPYPRESVMSEVRKSDHNTNMLNSAEPSSPRATLSSANFSRRSSESHKNWKDSLHQVVRPMTSRTKLISRSSYSRDSQSICSDTNSMDNVSHSDGFDSWDTSGVSLQAREAIAQSAPCRGTILEPIPGSRPASPARALDGPFPSEIYEEDEILQPPPKLLPDISRPPSPAVSEGHIHPLFRSESPNPPPEVLTPGTSIEASPLSTQMLAMPARPYGRMRSHSQTASPSVRSASYRGRATSSASRSRSSSPPSRAMTPPIPEFVLNASPRSSMSAPRNVKRKASSTFNSTP